MLSDRLFSIQIWIFVFAGSTNKNYVGYLLEMYCLFRYDASIQLKNAILDNWLINISGELGRWIERDLLQEHYNKWLENHIEVHGGNFDDEFYRKTISPNIEAFLRLKEELETAWDLKRRGKAHKPLHLHDEYTALLKLYREEEVHHFCSTRSMGHIAQDLFDLGCDVLRNDKINDFLYKSSQRARILELMSKLQNGHSDKTVDEEIDCIRKDLAVAMDIDSSNSLPETITPPVTESPPADAEAVENTEDGKVDDRTDEEDHDNNKRDCSNDQFYSGSDLMPLTDSITGCLQVD